ncbi:MAG: RNA polymerase sigma factor [Planctomycetota bacterium]
MTVLVTSGVDKLIRMQSAEPGREVGADTAARLRRLARSLARTPDEADELAQEAAARLLDRSPDKIGHAGYERQTVTRLWLDGKRSIARRFRRLAKAAWRPDTTTDNPAQGDTNAVVRRAMDTLPDRQRAVLVLVVVEGLTHAEAAASLGCSEAASRQSLKAARAGLRSRLESQFGEQFQ